MRMPKGNPNAQTVASTRYQKKVGIIVKGFKVKKELADAFAVACKKAGISQAAAVTAFMEEFIQKNK